MRKANRSAIERDGIEFYEIKNISFMSYGVAVARE
jgi:hypothetical protein